MKKYPVKTGIEEDRTILCTIDFTESSTRTLQWSAQMAQQLNASVLVLYTFRLTDQKNGEGIKIKQKREEQALLDFAHLERETLQDKKITYNFKTEVGFLNDRIEENVKKNSFQFLVMSKDLSLQIKDTFEELLNEISIPLVIVP